MKIGIVGSRSRNTENDKKLIQLCLLDLDLTELVSGGCKKGADKFAEDIAKEQKVPIKIFKPKKSDGNYFDAVKEYYARNKLIAEYCDILIAVVSSNRKGGTENTIKYAEKLNKKIILI